MDTDKYQQIVMKTYQSIDYYNLGWVKDENKKMMSTPF